MPALAFGLGRTKSAGAKTELTAKRSAAFQDDQADQSDDDVFRNALNKAPSPKKKPKLSGASTLPQSLDESHSIPTKIHNSNAQPSKYTNLSALRSAKLHQDEASKVDAVVYGYDELYDTFNADKKQKEAATTAEPTVPKYMTNLLASAEVRKRDQLRAKERQLQKEREEEGDEFADKEKFVTGAYKKQQEENRRIEEEERKREEAEEERRLKGGGMTAFHKDLLKKDEERQRAVEEAQKLAQMRNSNYTPPAEPANEEEQLESRIASDLNKKGAQIITNDDGEIVDKRQLLTAGLNVIPKKAGSSTQNLRNESANPQTWKSSSTQIDGKTAQRERQTRMLERQIEEMEAKQRQAEEAEQKIAEDKNKSKLSETDKLSAKERYLQRKREREAEATKGGAG